MPHKILITGSNGLLGHKLVPRLAALPEVELLLTSRGPARIAGVEKRINYVSLDIVDPGELPAVISSFRPDQVIHTAAMTNVDQCEEEPVACWRTNVDATARLLTACRSVGSRVLYLSTDFVFDGNEGPYTEEATPNPINHYGRSKLAGEQLVQQYELPWCIVRTVLVYGTMPGGGRSNLILMVRRHLREGKPLRLVDDQVRSPTLADDLADGCILAVMQGTTGIVHLAGNDLLTPYGMGVKVAERLGFEPSLIHRTVTAEFPQPARRPLRCGLVIDRAVNELGYTPHTFEEGIEVVLQDETATGDLRPSSS